MRNTSGRTTAQQRKRVGRLPFQSEVLCADYRLWGGQLSYIGFTNFDWGSDLAMTAVMRTTVLKHVPITLLLQPYSGAELRSLALLCRCPLWHNGGQWNDDAELNFGNGNLTFALPAGVVIW